MNWKVYKQVTFCTNTHINTDRKSISITKEVGWLVSKEELRHISRLPRRTIYRTVLHQQFIRQVAVRVNPMRLFSAAKYIVSYKCVVCVVDRFK